MEHEEMKLPPRNVEERYYVSQQEADLIRMAAFRRGITKSEYVRRVLIPRATRDANGAAA